MGDTPLLDAWQQQLADARPQAILTWAVEQFGTDLTFATSLGAEDQVLLDMMDVESLSIASFMLDTGRMFDETYALLAENRRRYSMELKVYCPEGTDLEAMVNTHGVNLFRESVALRKHCCFIRKVKPLRRALAGRQAWVTGMRREQSTTRDAVMPVEWDAGNGLYKINPLFAWTADDVWSYIRSRDVPYNDLHDHNYTSIGCAPCTRAIAPDEHERAGRWWWESADSRECGIHFVDGKVVRNRRNPSFMEAESADQEVT